MLHVCFTCVAIYLNRIISHFFFFTIAHYQDVILTVFKYINLLKKDGVQSRIFEEVQSLASLAFRFKEKYPPSQYTSRLAGLMQHGYPAAYVLSGPSLIREYDPELINENLSWLRPDNFRIMLASQNPPNGVEYTQKETWYGTEYNVLDFDEKLIEVIIHILRVCMWRVKSNFKNYSLYKVLNMMML